MRPLRKAPHYLVRNPYSHCFRVNVPNDLQRFVGKKELRYSLKTGYLSVAREKAQIIAGQVQQIFTYLRKGGIELSGPRTHYVLYKLYRGYSFGCTSLIDIFLIWEPLGVPFELIKKTNTPLRGGTL
jgi:hypothetical protein